MREPCKVSEVLAGTCFVGRPVSALGALLGLTTQLSRDVHYCFRPADHCTPHVEFFGFKAIHWGLRLFSMTEPSMASDLGGHFADPIFSQGRRANWPQESLYPSQ